MIVHESLCVRVSTTHYHSEMHPPTLLHGTRQGPYVSISPAGITFGGRVRTQPTNRWTRAGSSPIEELVTAGKGILLASDEFKNMFESCQWPPKAAVVAQARHRLADLHKDLEVKIQELGSVDCRADAARVLCLAMNAQLRMQISDLEKSLTSASKEVALVNLAKEELAGVRTLLADRAALKTQLLHMVVHLRKLERATLAAGEALDLPGLRPRTMASDSSISVATPAATPPLQPDQIPAESLDTPFTPGCSTAEGCQVWFDVEFESDLDTAMVAAPREGDQLETSGKSHSSEARVIAAAPRDVSTPRSHLPPLVIARVAADVVGDVEGRLEGAREQVRWRDWVSAEEPRGSPVKEPAGTASSQRSVPAANKKS
eukprot:jgi/Botrbrau1/12530/Bobra.0169s0072.1